jgi:hypothetical protein
MKKSKSIALTIIASACIVATGCSDDEKKTERQIYSSVDACEKDWGSGECEPDRDRDKRRYYGPNYYFIGSRVWYYPMGYGTPIETRPTQAASSLKPGAVSSGAVGHMSSSHSARGGFGSSAHAHGASGSSS